MLDLVSSLGKPVSVRDLVRGLSLDPAARRELKSVLRRLIADGALVKIRGARVGLPDRMNLVVGRLSCNPAGFGFVVPEVRREGQGDLFVAAVNIREALHGDRVVARVERHGPKGPEGRIIRVLERANQRIVGRYEDDGRFGGHVVPFDRRVLHEVFVPAGEEGGARGGADGGRGDHPAADRHPQPGRPRARGARPAHRPRRRPQGHHGQVRPARRLPARGGGRGATRRAPRRRRRRRRGRTDFRGWLTVTVDPETARDHDDAIGIERLTDGD